MQSLGHYQIRSELGRGGMGVVYKAYEPSLNRYVAIKVLARSLAHDDAIKERFLREARSMAALNDPHIIQIYFIGEEAGQTYFVMELVDGVSLSALIKHEGKLSAEQAAKTIYQTACGLAVAHDSGVIHRDIKPGNLIVNTRGQIKIADFGIALTTQDFSKKLTSSGEFVGTPGYLSPEVCLNKPVDQRSDIFALGVVLFECLTGRIPFKDESPLGLMLEVVTADIPDVRAMNAQVDSELSRILGRMIAKDPLDRYQSCHELIGDLARYPLVSKGGDIPLPQGIIPLAAAVRSNADGGAHLDPPQTVVTPALVGTKRAVRPSALGDALVLPDLGPSRPHGVPSANNNSRSGVGRAAALAAIVLGLVAISASAYLGRSTLFGAPGAATIASSKPMPDQQAGIVPAIHSAATPAVFDSNMDSTRATSLMTTPPTSGASGNLDDPSVVMDDALWLSDVPDNFLDANPLFMSDTDHALLATALASRTVGNVYLGPYTNPALGLIGSDILGWRSEIGVGYPFSWFGYGVPQPIYVGPLRQLVLVGNRPSVTSDIWMRPTSNEPIASVVAETQNRPVTSLPTVATTMAARSNVETMNQIAPRALAYSKSPMASIAPLRARDFPARENYRGTSAAADRAERYNSHPVAARVAERAQIRESAALAQSNKRLAASEARPSRPTRVPAPHVEKRHP